MTLAFCEKRVKIQGRLMNEMLFVRHGQSEVNAGHKEIGIFGQFL